MKPATTPMTGFEDDACQCHSNEVLKGTQLSSIIQIIAQSISHSINQQSQSHVHGNTCTSVSLNQNALQIRMTCSVQARQRKEQQLAGAAKKADTVHADIQQGCQMHSCFNGQSVLPQSQRRAEPCGQTSQGQMADRLSRFWPHRGLWLLL